MQAEKLASIEAEQSVIGGVLLNHTALDLIADRVQERDFYRAEHRAIWRAITAMSAESVPADVVTVAEWLDSHGELHAAGGMAYLGTLANNTPSSANIAAYADIVRNKSTERDMLAAAWKIQELVHGEGDTRTKLDKAQALLGQIAMDKASSGPVMASSLLAGVMVEIEANMNRKGGLLGVSTGFADLDAKTSGFQGSDLIIIAGRPSMGKTSLAMNIAEHVAVHEGQAVLVFSMEMGASQILQRSLASLGRVPFQPLRMGDLEAEQWSRVTSASVRIKQSRLVLDETPALTVTEVRARARRIHRDRPLGLVVVDYIQLMEGDGENRNAEVTAISRGLKALAKELKVPVIALSQLNRKVDDRANKRPGLSDLRESGAIEQDADVILFVYRDEVYNEQSEAKGTAEIIIGKQRNGPTGMVRLTFAGEYCRFDNYGGPEIQNVVRMPRRRGMED